MLSEYEICVPVASEAASKADVSGIEGTVVGRSIGMRRCENESKSGLLFRLPLADTRLIYIGMMTTISAWQGVKASRSSEMSRGLGEDDRDRFSSD